MNKWNKNWPFPLTLLMQILRTLSMLRTQSSNKNIQITMRITMKTCKYISKISNIITNSIIIVLTLNSNPANKLMLKIIMQTSNRLESSDTRKALIKLPNQKYIHIFSPFIPLLLLTPFNLIIRISPNLRNIKKSKIKMTILPAIIITKTSRIMVFLIRYKAIITLLLITMIT